MHLNSNSNSNSYLNSNLNSNTNKRTLALTKKINNIISTLHSIDIPEPDANLILKGSLWLGNIRVAHDPRFIKKEQIRYIVNATKNTQNVFPFIRYFLFPFRDIDMKYQNLLPMMENGADAIHRAVSSGSTILVHCKNGHHRSASIVALYLMKYHGMTLVEAIVFIKKKRPGTFDRMTYMLRALIWYECRHC